MTQELNRGPDAAVQIFLRASCWIVDPYSEATCRPPGSHSVRTMDGYDLVAALGAKRTTLPVQAGLQSANEKSTVRLEVDAGHQAPAKAK